MLGIALGQMGMSVEDFDQLTPTQFAITYKWYLKRVEIECKRSWEQTRYILTGILAPYSKKSLAPTDIMNFEWDEKEVARELTKEEIENTRKRFEELERLWGN